MTAPKIIGPKRTHVKLEDGTTWPNPCDPLEVEWQLRYGDALTREDQLFAASVMAAYRALATAPNGKQAPLLRRAVRSLRLVFGEAS